MPRHQEGFSLVGVFILLGLAITLLIIGPYLTNHSSQVNDFPPPQPSQATSLPTPAKSAVPPSPLVNENLTALNGDIKLSYLFDPHDNQNIIYKQVNFKSHTSQDLKLPYFSSSTNDKTKRGQYKISPSKRYILRITSKKLEITNLPSLDFHTIKELPVLADPKFPDFDFLNFGDADWDNQGQFYFMVTAGLDGVGSPVGGYYSDLYQASEDGSNIKLLSDHTKENQRLGILKNFSYFNPSKNEIYLGGGSHGGHLASMLIIDTNTGDLKKTLADIYTDITNPVFNKDFSKAYYENDFHDKGYLNPVKIYEYDLATTTKKLLYAVPNATEDYTTPQLTGNLAFNPVQNKLYFQTSSGDKTDFFGIDPTSPTNPQLLFSADNMCTRQKLSNNGDFVLLLCEDYKNETKEYQIYQVSAGQKVTFYKEKYDSEFYYPPTIQIIEFN